MLRIHLLTDDLLHFASYSNTGGAHGDTELDPDIADHVPGCLNPYGSTRSPSPVATSTTLSIFAIFSPPIGPPVATSCPEFELENLSLVCLVLSFLSQPFFHPQHLLLSFFFPEICA
ncbi:hypothetical protein KCU92_g324, partial [Aureobasidium melanogenum]